MSDIISKAECVQILKKYFKEKLFEEQWIKDYIVVRVSDGLVGFVGEYYKLRVELDDVKADVRKLSFFVKSVPITNELHRKECIEKGFFTKESQLYANLLGDLQKYSSKKLYPECYYTREDIIVLEDLSVQPLRHIPTGDDVSIDFFKVVIRNQAHLHAASIAYELDTRVKIGDKFKHVLYELQLTMNNVFCVTGLKSIVSLAKMIPKYRGTPVEEFINNKLYDVLCSACSLTEPSNVYRNVLCHRDVWTRNIFFECDEKNNPVDCLIVDFQLTRYSPPAIDVLYLISMATRKKQRDLIYDECLDYYYETFVEVMKAKGLEMEIFSRDEFRKSCHRLKLAVLILKAFGAPLMDLPEGLSTKMREEEPEQFDYYLNVDREELYLRVMEMVPGYKEIILEPTEELMEYLIKEFNL